jgi:hypothetical protein
MFFIWMIVLMFVVFYLNSVRLDQSIGNVVCKGWAIKLAHAPRPLTIYCANWKC